ncbi:MAG: hypothetical protein MUE44_25310 [Oscillatoriaceae cyanobacterium Prado104]|nr:hypothetical protein [Oscillatoriaceae cyanobacterium Prado104]
MGRKTESARVLQPVASLESGNRRTTSAVSTHNWEKNRKR